jgi:hypothetical protein
MGYAECQHGCAILVLGADDDAARYHFVMLGKAIAMPTRLLASPCQKEM